MGGRSFAHEPDEDVLVATNPHWILLVPVVAVATATLGGCVACFVLWATAPALFGAFLLLVVLATAFVVATKVMAWRSTLLVVTSRRVVYREGVLRRSGREIPTSRVQDVSYRQGLLGRLLGYGELCIESAGAQGAEPFRHIRRPIAAQRAVNRAVEAWSSPPERRHGGDGDVPSQLERLDALRQRGVVTEAEFAAKKAELLARM